jgi:predicted metal-dependent phosphotriesterase family hydrolase
MEDKVLAAVRELEHNISTRIHTHTTALEVNNERLQNLKEAMDKHRQILYGHDDGDKLGLIARMVSIEKMDKERKWTLRTVVASFLGMTGKVFWDLFSNH